MVNPLTCFRLQRTLNCSTLIAVPLCWHLCSRLDNPDASLCFSLLLDALCSGFWLQLLIYVHEQVNTLHRLMDLTTSIKVRQSESYAVVDLVQESVVELPKVQLLCIWSHLPQIQEYLCEVADACMAPALFMKMFATRQGESENY